MQSNEEIHHQNDSGEDTNGAFRSGFVAVVGRPSAGKSTLVNAICGGKVSIVSSIPQTTRNVIRGIYTDGRGQIVFLDTPGFHDSDKKFNAYLRSVVVQGIQDVDAVVYMIDTTRSPGQEENGIMELVKKSAVPVITILSKTDSGHSDLSKARSFVEAANVSWPTLTLGGLGETAHGASGGHHPAPNLPVPERKLVPANVSAVIDAIIAILPAGEPFYPDEYYTDQEPAFRIAEIVREQAIRHTREEVPHSLYVEVADLQGRDPDPESGQPSSLWARTFIYVERESQKGILVGKGARVITAIRARSEQLLNELFPYPVTLSLQVKVRAKWRKNDALLRRMIG